MEYDIKVIVIHTSIVYHAYVRYMGMMKCDIGGLRDTQAGEGGGGSVRILLYTCWVVYLSISNDGFRSDAMVKPITT